MTCRIMTDCGIPVRAYRHLHTQREQGGLPVYRLHTVWPDTPEVAEPTK